MREQRSLRAALRYLRPAARSRVTAQKHLLRRGVYLRFGPTAWRHWREPLPEHLRSTKASRPSRATSGRRLPGRVDLWLRRTLDAPSLFLVLRPRHSCGGFPIAVGTAGGGGLFLDPAGGLAVRHSPSPPLDTVQPLLRARWASSITSPRFEVSADGTWLREDYVTGRPLRALDVDGQLAVARKLFISYADLVRSEGRPSTADLLTAALPVLQALPQSGFVHLRRADILATLSAGPLVPTPIDFAAGNLVVTPSVTPVSIDPFPLAYLPFFYTPVMVITSKVSLAPLRARYFTGELDPELDILFRAAGLEFQRCQEYREALVALGLLAHAMVADDGTETARSKIDERLAASLRKAGLDEPSRWPTGASP
jgi:hypothetical protein